MEINAKLKERQKWSHEKPQLDNARRLRGNYFIDPEDKDFKEDHQECWELSTCCFVLAVVLKVRWIVLASFRRNRCTSTCDVSFEMEHRRLLSLNLPASLRLVHFLFHFHFLPFIHSYLYRWGLRLPGSPAIIASFHLISSISLNTRILPNTRVKPRFFHQPSMASTSDSVESIATPQGLDLDDDKIRALLASSLYLQEREASAERSQVYHSEREKLDVQFISRSDKYRETCRVVLGKKKVESRHIFR